MIHFWSAQKKKFTKDLPVNSKLSTTFQFQLDQQPATADHHDMLWLFFTDKWRKIGVWSAVGYQGYMYGLSGKVWNETSLQMADYDMLNVDYWCLMSLTIFQLYCGSQLYLGRKPEYL